MRAATLFTPSLDHGAVANDHRDVAVPHRQLSGQQRTGGKGGAEVLLLSQPRNVQLRFAIRPLGR
jgi:hypothetical protein